MTPSVTPPQSPEPCERDATTAVDLAGGVARVMGDSALFARVLERFLSDYRRSAAAIRAALAAGDTPTAQRLTHTLKSASGMIEATSLHRQARELEQALRAPAGELEPQLDRLEAELDRVLRELDEVLATGRLEQVQTPARAAHGAARVETLWTAPKALATLREMLDVGDGAAVEFVAEARTPLCAMLGESRLRLVVKAINEFDYELALKLLVPTTPH